jgi:hypothetical protein
VTEPIRRHTAESRPGLFSAREVAIGIALLVATAVLAFLY